MTTSEIKPLLLTGAEVEKMVGLSIKTLALIDFPAPVNINVARNRWRREDVEEWIRKLPKRSDRNWGH